MSNPCPPSQPSPTPVASGAGRNGKVARLPKTVRDQINAMLQDGVPYNTIIERLGPQGEGLSDQNLSTWRAGGYLDWLRQLQLTQALQLKYELAQSIVARSGSDNAAGHAVLQTIATNLCEFLAETDPSILRESLLSDADKFTRFVNSMVRLAEGGIKCELHKFRSEDRAAEAAKQNTPPEARGISEESLHTAEAKLNLL
jgi:hypothetical protein